MVVTNILLLFPQCFKKSVSVWVIGTKGCVIKVLKFRTSLLKQYQLIYLISVYYQHFLLSPPPPPPHIIFQKASFPGLLTHSHTMTPFDAPGKQAF